MKKCLVVDDTDFDRNVMCQIVESLGFNATPIDNAKSALEYCNKEMPDIIMLDWNMPIMNGLEFLQSLRSMKNGEDPAVIMCTGEDQPKMVGTAMLNGANNYIVKPFFVIGIKQKLLEIGAL